MFFRARNSEKAVNNDSISACASTPAFICINLKGTSSSLNVSGLTEDIYIPLYSLLDFMIPSCIMPQNLELFTNPYFPFGSVWYADRILFSYLKMLLSSKQHFCGFSIVILLVIPAYLSCSCLCWTAWCSAIPAYATSYCSITAASDSRLFTPEWTMEKQNPFATFFIALSAESLVFRLFSMEESTEA